MLGKKLIHFLVILLVCAVLKRGNHKSLKHRNKSVKSSRQPRQNFHEVDAFGDDFVDFGASSGRHGQFYWHADFPLDARWKQARDLFRLIANICFAKNTFLRNKYFFNIILIWWENKSEHQIGNKGKYGHNAIRTPKIESL